MKRLCATAILLTLTTIFSSPVALADNDHERLSATALPPIERANLEPVQMLTINDTFNDALKSLRLELVDKKRILQETKQFLKTLVEKR